MGLARTRGVAVEVRERVEPAYLRANTMIPCDFELLRVFLDQTVIGLTDAFAPGCP